MCSLVAQQRLIIHVLTWTVSSLFADITGWTRSLLGVVVSVWWTSLQVFAVGHMWALLLADCPALAVVPANKGAWWLQVATGSTKQNGWKWLMFLWENGSSCVSQKASSTSGSLLWNTTLTVQCILKLGSSSGVRCWCYLQFQGFGLVKHCGFLGQCHSSFLKEFLSEVGSDLELCSSVVSQAMLHQHFCECMKGHEVCYYPIMHLFS